MSDDSKLSKIILFVQVAGFFIMLAFGFMGFGHFLLGLSLYVVGMILSLAIKQDDQLSGVVIVNLILFLINLVFFSSTELVTWVDVSFAIYLVILLQLLLLFGHKVRSEGLSYKQLPYLFAIIFFLVSIIFSALSTERLKEVIYFLVINLGALFVFFSAANLLKRRSEIIIVVKTLVILGAVSAATALWQLYSSSFKFLYYPYLALRDQQIMELWEVVSRVVGTWQHPSYLGIFLALCFPLCVFLIFYESQSRKQKFFWSASLLFLGASLLLTNTRSSVLSAVLGVMLVYILANLKGLQYFKSVPSVKKIALLGLLAAGSLLLYQFVFVAEIYQKPQAWRVDASATIWGRFLRADSMSSESLVQRSQLYRLAWQRFLENPVFGIGAKNFSFEAEDLFDKGTDAHSIVLQTAAEQGILGLLAIVVLYGIVIIRQTRRVSEIPKGQARYLQSAMLAVIFLVFFDSFFNNPLYSLRILAIFWLVLALQQVNLKVSFHAQS